MLMSAHARRVHVGDGIGGGGEGHAVRGGFSHVAECVAVLHVAGCVAFLHVTQREGREYTSREKHAPSPGGRRSIASTPKGEGKDLLARAMEAQGMRGRGEGGAHPRRRQPSLAGRRYVASLPGGWGCDAR
ncbi:hypothetical protein BD413DRAFT_525837 [Trametes elegans]|nr:hypothetical protein BD413DRAFT_525837 [Trametes elegans]